MGQSRLLSLDPRDAKQRYDVIGDLPPDSPARARLWPGDKFVAQLSRAGTAETTAVVIERISGTDQRLTSTLPLPGLLGLPPWYEHYTEQRP